MEFGETSRWCHRYFRMPRFVPDAEPGCDSDMELGKGDRILPEVPSFVRHGAPAISRDRGNLRSLFPLDCELIVKLTRQWI
jgi:hypothetical protein